MKAARTKDSLSPAAVSAGSSANASPGGHLFLSGDNPMIHRKIYIATAIIASVAITACSDTTAPKSLVAAGSEPVAILASSSAAAKTATVVATINGGGTANMDDGK